MDECDICLEPFNSDRRRPKVLPCGHTFCLDCLEKDEKRGSRSCATDRKVYDMSPKDLPDNYYILSKQETLRNARKSSLWCIDCKDVANENCELSHNLKNLKAVRLEQINKNLNVVQEEMKEVRVVLDRLDLLKNSINAALEDCVERRLEHFNHLTTVLRNTKRGMESDSTSWRNIKNHLDDTVAACSSRQDRYLDEHRLLTLSSGSLKVHMQGYPFAWKGSFEMGGDENAESRSVLRTLLFLLSDRNVVQREVSLPVMNLRELPPLVPVIPAPQVIPPPPPPPPPQTTGFIKEEVVDVPLVEVVQDSQPPEREGDPQPSQSSSSSAPVLRVRPMSELMEARAPAGPQAQQGSAATPVVAVRGTPPIKRGSPLEAAQQSGKNKKLRKLSPYQERQNKLREKGERLECLNPLRPDQISEAEEIQEVAPNVKDENIQVLDTGFDFRNENILDVDDLSSCGPKDRKIDKEIVVHTTRKIKSLCGLNCGPDPEWSAALLKAQQLHLEDLQVWRAGAEHLAIVSEMPMLRRLEVRASPKLLKDLDSVSRSSPGGRRSTLQVAYLEMPPHRALTLVSAHASTLRDLTLIVGLGPCRDNAIALWPWNWNRLENRLKDCKLTALERLSLQRFPSTASKRHFHGPCPDICLRQVGTLMVALPGVLVRCVQCAGQLAAR